MPYKARWSPLDDIQRDVSEEIATCFDGDVSLVGHSMGGLVARRIAELGIPGIRIRRMVMIGTPLLGNQIPQYFSRLPLKSLPYGRLSPALSPESCHANSQAIDGVEMGLVAGSVPGGSWLCGEETDGIVTVPATNRSGLTDHPTVSASHASLLLARKVAAMTAHFLANGIFSGL